MRTPQHTFYTACRLGQMQGFMFAPIRPGESLLNLELDLSLQSDRLVQDQYTPPLIVDVGVWHVPLTLLQSEDGDDYVKAFAGEAPSNRSTNKTTDGYSSRAFNIWRGLLYDLISEVARTFFSRTGLTPTYSETGHLAPRVFIGREFLPAAAGEYTILPTDTVTTLEDVYESLLEFKAQRLEETTYLEALHRYGVSGKEARNIPEVVLWERRVLHGRQDLLPSGGGENAASDQGTPPDRTLFTAKDGTNIFNYLTSGVPAVSLGTQLNEQRNKVMKFNGPGFLVGGYVVREALLREGFFKDADEDPKYSHAELMTLADDWCPPGTGFNDAFRAVANGDNPSQITAADNTSCVTFDPMMYLFYGEQFSDIDSVGGLRNRQVANRYYDGAGREIFPATTSGTGAWSFYAKGLSRLEIHTDLTD